MGVRVSVNGHMCPNNRRDIDIFRKYLKKMMARDDKKIFEKSMAHDDKKIVVGVSDVSNTCMYVEITPKNILVHPLSM